MRIRNYLTAAFALSLLTACGEAESPNVSSDLEGALANAEAQAEAAALRHHGMDPDAEDGGEAADGEDERLMGPPAADEEAGHRPDVDPAEHCAEMAEQFVERCEADRAEAADVPEDAPACADLLERAEDRCLRHARRNIQRRIRACHAECRPEARDAMQACMEDEGEREACREAAIDAVSGCHEACPDAPEGDAAERPAPDGDAADRPERPAPDGDAGDRPERPAPDGERPPRGEGGPGQPADGDDDAE